MTVGTTSEQLSEVRRLCTLLADRVLDAKIMDRPVPASSASRLLETPR